MTAICTRNSMTTLKFTVIICLLMAIGASAGWSKDYRVRKKNNGYMVDMLINRNPPVIGDNQLRIRIHDPSGTSLVDAQVVVNYYMPPMPGMPPMNYTIPANQDGDSYTATLEFIMTGPWNIVIKIKKEGLMWKVTCPIDVR